MSEAYVSQVVIEALLSSNPATALLYPLLGTETIGEVLVLANKSLSPANLVSSVGNTIVSPFIEIWNWLLYNFISPLLVIIFVVLFFVGQYYLLKMYLKFFQYVGANIIKFIGWTSQNTKFKRILNNFVNVTFGK